MKTRWHLPLKKGESVSSLLWWLDGEKRTRGSVLCCSRPEGLVQFRDQSIRAAGRMEVARQFWWLVFAWVQGCGVWVHNDTCCRDRAGGCHCTFCVPFFLLPLLSSPRRSERRSLHRRMKT